MEVRSRRAPARADAADDLAARDPPPAAHAETGEMRVARADAVAVIDDDQVAEARDVPAGEDDAPRRGRAHLPARRRREVQAGVEAQPARPEAIADADAARRPRQRERRARDRRPRERAE